MPPLKLPNNRTIAIGVCCIALIAIFFIYGEATIHKNDTKDQVIAVFANPFATSTIEAKGAVVYMPTSNRTLYQKNASTSLPLASVTKIMTAYITSLIFQDDDTITIQSSDLTPEGDVGLVPGEKWKFSDLRDIMLVASANDAAEAIRRATDERLALTTSSTTIDLMNEKARELGLSSLKFESVSGLDDLLADGTAGEATVYGSARDITLLFAYIIQEKPEIFESTRETTIYRGPTNGKAAIFKNTNVTVNDLPSIIASKTGYTEIAGGNLIAAFDAGLRLPIIITVLGSDNQDTRFTDMQELASKTMLYINTRYYTGN